MSKRTSSNFQNGVVMAGSWEAFHQRLRLVGDQNGINRKVYDRHHTKEAVDRLKEAGVNLYITHLYKGAGVEIERWEMEKTVDLAKLCHDRGIKVGVYVQTLSSIYYESFFNEVPEAVDWVSRDQNGKIPIYADQYFRYIACPTCDEYLEYIEREVLRYAVKKVNADLIHFDNFRWWGEPEACRCDRCAEKFRHFITEAMPDENERYSRIGVRDLTHVKPPEFHFLNPPWKKTVLRGPLEKLWADFKSQVLADIYKRFADYLRELNPDIAVECNVDVSSGSNCSINRGAWEPSIYPNGDFFWREGDDYPELTENGTLVSRIRSYKAAQALDNAMFSYNFDELALAESMAFNNNCLGMIGFVRDILGGKRADLKTYTDFYLKNNNLFQDSESAAEIAVFYSYHTLNYLCADPHLQLILAEQCLIQGHVPFDILYDNRIERIEKYKCVILPEVDFLSDELIDNLRDYVANGGNLLVTGKSSVFTERGIRREQPVFNEILGIDLEEEAKSAGNKKARGVYGKGKIAYIPRLVPSIIPQGKLSPTYWTRAIYYDKRWWKKPENYKHFLEVLGWVANELSLNILAPETLVVELRLQVAAGRRLLHLVNYAPANVEQVKCKLKTVKNGKLDTLRVYSPDTEEISEIPVTQRNDSISFSIGNLKTYAIIEIKEQ